MRAPLRAPPAAVAGVALVSVLLLILGQTAGFTVSAPFGVESGFAQNNAPQPPTTGWCCIPELYGPECQPGLQSLDECRNAGVAIGATIYGGSNFEATTARGLCDSPCGLNYTFSYCQNRRDVLDAALGIGPPAAPVCTSDPVPDNGLGGGVPLPEKGYLEEFNCLQACNLNGPCDCYTCNDADAMGKMCDETQCEMNPSCVAFYEGNGEWGCEPDPGDPDFDNLVCSSSSSSSSVTGPYYACCQLVPASDYGGNYVTYVGADGSPLQPDAIKPPNITVPGGVSLVYTDWSGIQSCLASPVSQITVNIGDTGNPARMASELNYVMSKCHDYGIGGYIPPPDGSSSSRGLGYIPPYSASSRSYSPSSLGIDDLKCPRGIAPETYIDVDGNPESCSPLYAVNANLVPGGNTGLGGFTVYMGGWWRLQGDRRFQPDSRYICHYACQLSQTIVRCLDTEEQVCLEISDKECYARNGVAYQFNVDGSNICTSMAPLI